jgi:hypothetical protein
LFYDKRRRLKAAPLVALKPSAEKTFYANADDRHHADSFREKYP